MAAAVAGLIGVALVPQLGVLLAAVPVAAAAHAMVGAARQRRIEGSIMEVMTLLETLRQALRR